MKQNQKGAIEIILVLIIIGALAFAVVIFFLTQPKIKTYVQLPPANERTNVELERGDDYLSVSSVGGREVGLSEVSLGSSGFVVIRADNEGEPGAVIGISELISAGTHTSLSVGLNRSVKDEVVYAMLYKDDGDGSFTVSADLPVTDDFENEIFVTSIVGEIPFLDTEF